eukprot:648270-Prorocentrum_lima.AAC.1
MRCKPWLPPVRRIRGSRRGRPPDRPGPGSVLHHTTCRTSGRTRSGTRRAGNSARDLSRPRTCCQLGR